MKKFIAFLGGIAVGLGAATVLDFVKEHLVVVDLDDEDFDDANFSAGGTSCNACENKKSEADGNASADSTAAAPSDGENAETPVE